jgi:hypothetical protein
MVRRRADHVELIKDANEAIQMSRRMIDFIRRHKEYDSRNISRQRESVRLARSIIANLDNDPLPRLNVSHPPHSESA